MTAKDAILNELLNQVMDAALTLLFLGLGVSYFIFGQSWQKAIGVLASNAGLAATPQSEITLIFQTISRTFPFNFLTQTTFTSVIIVGAILLAVTVFLKILSARSRAELAEDFGKALFIPGIVGLIAMGIVQYLTASSLSDLAKTSSISIISQTSTLFVWSAMGRLIVFGVVFLFVGYILRHVMRQIANKPVIFYLIARFLIAIGWIFTIFYVVYRLLVTDIISTTFVGSQGVKIYTLAWYLSQHGLIAALFLFVFGIVLFQYGRRIRRTAWGRERPLFVQKLRYKAKKEFWEAEQRNYERKEHMYHIPQEEHPSAGFEEKTPGETHSSRIR